MSFFSILAFNFNLFILSFNLSTSVLSLLGGLGDITQTALRDEEMWERFEQVVEREYGLVFGSGPLPGSLVEYALPNALVPTRVLGNFTHCT